MMPETVAMNGDNGDGPNGPSETLKPIGNGEENGSSPPNGALLPETEPKSKLKPAFLYEDSDHFGFLLDKLNCLRKNKQFCDVILQVGNQQDIHEVYAHRAVLASASPYFLDMFCNDSLATPCGIPSIQLYKLLSGNYDAEAFENLVDYIYTSRLEIGRDKVKAVYALANKLKMTSVAHQCGQFLASTLTPESCLAVRAIPGVLSDPILLNAVDNYIRTNIGLVVQTKALDSLAKVQIEVLQNNNEERAATNEKHLFSMVLEWIRKAFDRENLNMTIITEKMYMLYLNKLDKSLHDCDDIKKGDTNFSEVIQDYKRLSRKLSLSNKPLVVENGKGEASGPGLNLNQLNQHQTSSKPRQFLFTRSDSDSSLSSIADDDESDWKVLGTHTTSKHTMMGLVMIGGKLCVLKVKLRLNLDTQISDTSPSEDVDTKENTRKDSNCASITPMSLSRCALGTAELEGKLMACGGYDRGECLKTVEVYDEESNQWSEMTPMKVPRGRFDVAVVKGCVYAVGGCDGQKELSSAEMYDPVLKVWQQLPNSPVVRSNAGLSTVSGKVYAVGGWNGQRGMQRCDMFDPETQEWTQVGSMLVGRYQAGVVAFNEEIYAVGGCDSWTCLNSVEKYSPLTNTWKMVDSLSTARRGCGVAVFRNKLYVVGGHDGMHSLRSVEVLDFESNSWSSGPSLTCSRANVGVVTVKDRLYAVGGFSGKTFLNSVEFLDVVNNEWTSYIEKDFIRSTNCATNGTHTETSVTLEEEENNIHHSLSKSSLSDEPLVEVEEESQPNP